MRPVAAAELVHDPRPGPAGGDRVDADPIGGEIHRLAAGELEDRSLGYGVEPATRLGDLRADRGEVDDCAAGSPQVLPSGLQHHHVADDVDVVALEPIVARRVEPLIDINARKVDQEVDRAIRRDRFGYACVAGFVVAQVGGDKAHLIAELSREPRSTLRVNVSDHHLRSGLCEGTDNCLADDRRPTGDNRGLAFEASHESIDLTPVGISG
jgi:hypothetical protein